MNTTTVLTGVLVVITGYYAWQNRKMAQEMAAARRISVFPKLVLEWTMASPVLGFPTLKNVGPGAALDVDITISFEALREGGLTESRNWTASVVVPGEERQFLPPSTGGGGMMDTEAVARAYSRVVLTGHYRDALGEPQVAADVLPDIAEWRAISKAAHARWEEPDPTKRLAKELAERLGKNTLVPALKGIAGQIRQ
jgi:hypothetical protein